MRDAYPRGSDRDEQQRLPPRLEDFVDRDNPVRVVDAFVDGMSSGDAQGALPEERVMEDNGGRPGYSPRAMAKLFIWGYIDRMRSTGRLEKECTRNTELMWLINGLRPDRSRGHHAQEEGGSKHFTGGLRSSSGVRVGVGAGSTESRCASSEPTGAPHA